MLSVIILDNGESNVIQLTYENLYRELKDIEGSELIIAKDWFKPLFSVKNPYFCLVEPDCLVSSGYFSSMMGLIKKDSYLRKMAVFGSATGVNSFGNRFFGYELKSEWAPPAKDDNKKVSVKVRYIEPVRTAKSTVPYPVQMVYIPGAILRSSMVIPLFEKQAEMFPFDDLLRFSSNLSLHFWSNGGRVHINPNMTYVTTENYVNDLGKTDQPSKEVLDSFQKESI